MTACNCMYGAHDPRCCMHRGRSFSETRTPVPAVTAPDVSLDALAETAGRGEFDPGDESCGCNWDSGPHLEHYCSDCEKWNKERKEALAALLARAKEAERQRDEALADAEVHRRLYAASVTDRAKRKRHAEAAEAKLAEAEKALERIASTTEITGDGLLEPILEDPTGCGEHELKARMRIAENALARLDAADRKEET